MNSWDTMFIWIVGSAFGIILFLLLKEHVFPYHRQIGDEPIHYYFTELSGHVFYCNFKVDFPHDWTKKRHEVPVLLFSENIAWVYGWQWRHEESFEAAGIPRSLMEAFFPYVASFTHNEVELTTGQILFAAEWAQLCQKIRKMAKSHRHYEKLVQHWCLSTHIETQYERATKQRV